MSARMRAADTDRQEAAEELAQHVGSGRLTTDEYDERVQKAYRATYLDEIDDLFGDLPGRSGFAGNSPFGGSSGNPFQSAFTGPLSGSGSPAGGIRSAAARSGMRQAARRSPVGAVLAAVVGVAALMLVLSVVVGVIAVALHLIVPVLVIMLVVGLVRGRRGGPRFGPGVRRGFAGRGFGPQGPQRG